MCSMCMSSPCNSRCPNAPEPISVFLCRKCGFGIFEGEKYFESEEGPICEDCLSEMSAEEYLEFIGETVIVAKKEER